MKALNEYNSLSEYIADCQRENERLKAINATYDKEAKKEAKKEKGLFALFIEILVAPFRR